jgi:hypothetical protein
MIHQTPSDIRQALIDAGMLVPGSLPDAELTLLQRPPASVLRIDEAGRGAAYRQTLEWDRAGRRVIEFRSNAPRAKE